MPCIELLYVIVPSASALNPASEGINACFQVQKDVLQKLTNGPAGKIIIAFSLFNKCG